MPLIVYNVFLEIMAGALIYRMRGGMPRIPRPIEQAMFCVTYLVTLFSCGVPLVGTALAFCLSVAACCTGHGQYFPEMKAKYIEPEFFDFIVRAVMGPDPRTNISFKGLPENHYLITSAIERYGKEKLRARCLAGMSITGLAVTLPIGIALSLTEGHYWHGFIIANSGILKGYIYRYTKSTEAAEYGTGGVLWGINALCRSIFRLI